MDLLPRVAALPVGIGLARTAILLVAASAGAFLRAEADWDVPPVVRAPDSSCSSILLLDARDAMRMHYRRSPSLCSRNNPFAQMLDAWAMQLTAKPRMTLVSLPIDLHWRRFVTLWPTAAWRGLIEPELAKYRLLHGSRRGRMWIQHRLSRLLIAVRRVQRSRIIGDERCAVF